MKTQTKIAGIFFVFTLTAAAATGGLVYHFITQYSFSEFYKRLQVRALLTAKSVLSWESEVQRAVQIDQLEKLKLPGQQQYFFRITNGTIADSLQRRLNLPASFYKTLIVEGVATHHQKDTFFTGIRFNSAKGSYAVILSAENYYTTHHLPYLRNIMLISLVILSSLSLVVSVLFSKYVFNPVKTITNSVKAISSQNLHLRLNPTVANDELHELSVTFNTMLDRLETAFQTQNNFISNASHELSTPLTSIMGEAEVALSKERDAAAYKEALQKILNEAVRLEAITRSLLLLAQTGFDGKKQKFERVRTDQLLWDVKETLDKMNPKNQIQIDLSKIPEAPEQLKVMGNAQLLQLALVNIVNNACKYSANGVVKLDIETSAQKVYLTVSDHGIGIPEGEINKIFDPFFRASNAKNFGGYGIGLPLTQAILRIHGADITIESKLNKGTKVRLVFPVAPLV